MTESTHCYIGRKPCGCLVAITSDEPDMPKETAKEVAEWIRKGWTIERLTVAEGREALKSFGCKCKKRSSRQEQTELFA